MLFKMLVYPSAYSMCLLAFLWRVYNSNRRSHNALETDTSPGIQPRLEFPGTRRLPTVLRVHDYKLYKLPCRLNFRKYF